MPMIGNQATQGRFIELDSLTASATANYTLQLNSANFEPESVNNLLVSINGVIQGSSTMSLNGAVLTVGATLSSSDTIDFVRVFGNVGTVSTPTDGSVTANKIGTGAVTSAKIADGTIVNADISATAGIVGSKLGTGAVVQVDNVTSFASTTGTTAMPFDDTIPQNNEGDEFLTLAFTPTSATNKLYINVHGHWGSTAVNSWLTVALFQDSISNAIAVSTAFDSIANGCLNHGLTHFMTAGTTSETTFKVRVGRNGSSTVRMNGTDGSRFFGGVLGSGITITEIGA